MGNLQENVGKRDLERDGEHVGNAERAGGFSTIRPRSESGTLPSILPNLTGEATTPLAEQFGRYRILRKLGEGGMGAVYLAHDTQLDRDVALKVPRFPPEQATDVLARFYREARAAATVNHPNICPVFDVGECEGVHYLTMAYLEGPSLAATLESGPRPRVEAAALARKLALALDEAHRHGIVHRDLKPANIIIDSRGEPVILDFGLARRARASEVQLTREGDTCGTPAYMAPEQVLGNVEAIGPGTDIYALGAVLYEMLTGRTPFTGTMGEVWTQIVTREPPPPSAFRPEVDPELERICLRALAKEVKDRFASGADLGAALERYLQADRSADTPRSQATAPPAQCAVAQPSRRRRLLPIAIAGILATIGALGIAVLVHSSSKNSAEGTAAGPPAAGPAEPGGPPIKVGILHSLTGTMATSETTVVDATLLALEELNARGGVLGRPLEPVLADGRSEAHVFAKEAERLITQDKVCVLFGCWTSDSRKCVRTVVEAHDHLLMYPLQSEGLEQSPNIAYLGAAPNQQIIPAVKWCFAFLEKRRFFLAGSDYVFPRAANAILKDELKTMGGEVVGEEYLCLGNTDAGDIIKKIQIARPDVILNTINGDSNVAFFRSLRAAGITPQTVPTVSFSIAEHELRSMSLAEMAGDYAAWNYFQSLEREENRRFVERLKAKYGPQRVVTDPMQMAYLGVHLWAKAAAAAGTTATRAVRTALRDQRYDAPCGPVWMDPETLSTYLMAYIGQIRADGQFDIVWASGAPLRPIPYPKTRTPAQWDAFLNDLYRSWQGNWENPRRP